MFDFTFCTTLGKVGESFVWWIFLCLVNFFWYGNDFPHSGQAFVAFGSFSFAVCALAVCLFRLCLNLVSYGHNVQVRMDRDFSFLVCCLMWFLCWSFSTRNAWHSVHVKWPVSCALAWWAMRSTTFAKLFTHSVQGGSQRHSCVSFCLHTQRPYGAPELIGQLGKALAQGHNFSVGIWKMVVPLS